MCHNTAMKLIGYVRVSTARQQKSGLGLEAQLFTLNQYAASVNGNIVHIYREVESGTDSARPEIAKAIVHAKRIRGRLVIAALDRLARKVHFVTGLQESGVDFVNCESPNDDRMMTQFRAVMDEKRALEISQKTSAALQAAKAKGKLLGSARPGHWDGREAARLRGALEGSQVAKAKRDAEAEPIYREVLPTIQRLRDEDESFQAIAKHLNDEGFTTVRGSAWNAKQVFRLVNSAVATVVVAGTMSLSL
jgi:DNA invertase Pin-like site-specific DNA recombinase